MALTINKVPAIRRRRLSAADLAWAEVVFVMEREQRKSIRDQFAGTALPEIRVLDVPDEFEFMDPRLQEQLREAIDPEIESLLQGRD